MLVESWVMNSFVILNLATLGLAVAVAAQRELSGRGSAGRRR